MKPSHRNKYYSHLYYQNHQLQNNFSAIYIDNLYAEPSLSEAHAKHKHARAGTSRGKEVMEEKVVPRNENRSLNNIEDAWSAIVAKSPQLRCVDERAEEFIYKFREDMKIERERSLLEFQKMLARSA
ncbi:hypothetical protein Patl1_25598 [Pistacia atlantica]|uniref:Uncharacterized protein n=1 Tax=Pistacia atlantica TaxID=434234 RepID=A0ACC1B4F0_9ROSI|nr:hypothetical protein Patl1_25598 [Pistacia atlantica]